ncbi:MAG TPA: tryptophan--tRNA ligase, partial [Bacteroidales bacterium]|nr:tryptophan--tRNA ligase [Bacteroidales bacterium]HPZ35814.1 tryptophan--tRNA ligase [Bacteroidales bacterium]
MNNNIVVSGIRPTGYLHIGNYFGAIRNFVEMQNEYQCYFFVADYHSLTTNPNPKDLQNLSLHLLAELLACGLDPQKATLYLQSEVPEVIELYLVLNMNAYLGELMRVTTFKEKARKQPENVNAGLLTYPTLMASDILIHKAAKVPVGKDQEQHLEMTRNFAARFNRIYNVDYFPLPVAFDYSGNLIKVPSLDGKGKMGKSEDPISTIFLVDDDETIRKKIMRAVTDAGPTEKNQPVSESINNLFNIMSLVSTPETLQYFKDKYNDATIKYSELKNQLAVDMIAAISPIREKINDIFEDKKYLYEVIDMGKAKAQKSARKTINDIREIIGFRKLY